MLAQYESKIPNGIEGSCTVKYQELLGNAGIVLSCALDAPRPGRKTQDWLFNETNVVQIRPSLTAGSGCNDICHQSRKEDAIDLIPGRAAVCLGGGEIPSPEGWVQTYDWEVGTTAELEFFYNVPFKRTLGANVVLFQISQFASGNKGRVACGGLTSDGDDEDVLSYSYSSFSYSYSFV